MVPLFLVLDAYGYVFKVVVSLLLFSLALFLTSLCYLLLLEVALFSSLLFKFALTPLTNLLLFAVLPCISASSGGLQFVTMASKHLEHVVVYYNYYDVVA